MDAEARRHYILERLKRALPKHHLTVVLLKHDASRVPFVTDTGKGHVYFSAPEFGDSVYIYLS